MIRQRPQRLARNVSHKVACTGANTTQTKAGNGRNDCAEFTHAPTKSRCTGTNTTQTKAGNGRNDCAEFTHAPTSRAAPSPQTKHNNTNKSRQWPQRLCGIYPRAHKSRCTIAPNTTTQTKAGNGRNDCAEFTHAPTSRCAARSAKKNPATAALIMRNFRTVDTKSQQAKM